MEQFCRFVASAQTSQGHDDPDGGMRVLAAVFADARRVRFDVAGIVRRPIERRVEQQEQAEAARDERCANAVHRALGKPDWHRAR
jgi:hypothetical protein